MQTTPNNHSEDKAVFDALVDHLSSTKDPNKLNKLIDKLVNDKRITCCDILNDATPNGSSTVSDDLVAIHVDQILITLNAYGSVGRDQLIQALQARKSEAA